MWHRLLIRTSQLVDLVRALDVKLELAVAPQEALLLGGYRGPLSVAPQPRGGAIEGYGEKACAVPFQEAVSLRLTVRFLLRF